MKALTRIFESKEKKEQRKREKWLDRNPSYRHWRDNWQTCMAEWRVDNSMTPQLSQQLSGHNFDVNGVAGFTLSADGYLVSADHGHKIKLWDWASGECVSTIRINGSIGSLAVLPDGRLAVGVHGAIHIVDVESGQCVMILQGVGQFVRSINVLTEDRIASFTIDHTLKVWDVTTGTCVLTLSGPAARNSSAQMVTLPDGRLAIVRDSHHTIPVWNVNTGEKEVEITTDTGVHFSALAVLPNCYLASGSTDGTIKFWGSTGSCVQTLSGHTQKISDLEVLPDGRLVSMSGSDGQINLWDISSGEKLATLQGKQGSGLMKSLPDGRLAFAGKNDDSIYFYDVGARRIEDADINSVWVQEGSRFLRKEIPTREEREQRERDLRQEREEIKQKGREELQKKYLENASSYASWQASWQEKVAEFQIDENVTPHILKTLSGHKGWVTGVAELPDGRLVSASGSEETITLRDSDTGECVSTMSIGTTVQSFAVLPNGHLAIGGVGVIKIFDIDRAQCVMTLSGVGDRVFFLAVLPESRLVSVSANNVIKVWDVARGECVVTVSNAREPARFFGQMVVLPDGRLAGTHESQMNVIHVWNTNTGVCEGKLIGHDEVIDGLAVLPDGRLASAGSGGNAIKLWNLADGTCVSTLVAEDHKICTLTVLADGRLVSKGFLDGVIKLWDVKEGRETATLEAPKHGFLIQPLSDGRMVSLHEDSFSVWDVGARRLKPDTRKSLWLQEGGQLIRKEIPTREEREQRERELREQREERLQKRRLESESYYRNWRENWQQRMEKWCVDTSVTPKVSQELPGHNHWVVAFVDLPDGRLATGGVDETIKFWDLKKHQCVSTISVGTRSMSLAVLPDGRLASGGFWVIKIFDVKSGQCVKTLPDAGYGVDFLFTLPDGRLASLSTPDGRHDRPANSDPNFTTRIWDVASGTCVFMISPSYRIAALPDGCIASVDNTSKQNVIQLWDVNAKECWAELTGHSVSVHALEVLPNGYLASGDENGVIKLWDVAQGICVKTFSAPNSGRINSFTVLLDGRLAAVSIDFSIRLWDTKNGKNLATFQGVQHSGAIKALADGRIAVGKHGSFPLFDVGSRPRSGPAWERKKLKREKEGRNREIIESCKALRERWSDDTSEVLLERYDEMITAMPLAELYEQRAQYYIFLAQSASVDQAISWLTEALKDCKKIEDIDRSYSGIKKRKKEIEKQLNQRRKERVDRNKVNSLKEEWESASPDNIVEQYKEIIEINNQDKAAREALGDYYVFCSENAERAAQKKLFYRKALGAYDSVLEIDAYDDGVAKKHDEISVALRNLEQGVSSSGRHAASSSGLTEAIGSSSLPMGAISQGSAGQGEDTLGGLDRLLVPYTQLNLATKLGEGGFGVVYKGTWQLIDVAIKQLKVAHLSERAIRDFTQEARKHESLRHPNIVALFGICLDPGHYSLIMEFMPNGSLYDVLHGSRDLEWSLRYTIARQVATGLSYLHKKNILHRDMKSLNVLMSEDMTAKLSDFGLSKEVKQESSTATSAAQAVGSLLWMAPELFKRGAKHSEASDIYALGVIFWELASRKRPFQDEENATEGNVRAWIKDGERDEIPAETPTGFSELIERCWAQRTADRPRDAAAVAMELSAAQAATAEDDKKVSVESSYAMWSAAPSGNKVAPESNYGMWSHK